MTAVYQEVSARPQMLFLTLLKKVLLIIAHFHSPPILTAESLEGNLFPCLHCVGLQSALLPCGAHLKSQDGIFDSSSGQVASSPCLGCRDKSDKELLTVHSQGLGYTGCSEYLPIAMDFPKIWFKNKRTWPGPPLRTFLLWLADEKKQLLPMSANPRQLSELD